MTEDMSFGIGPEFVESSCEGEIIRLRGTYTEGAYPPCEIQMSIIDKHGHSTLYSWRERLKAAWKILRSGKHHESDRGEGQVSLALPRAVRLYTELENLLFDLAPAYYAERDKLARDEDGVQLPDLWPKKGYFREDRREGAEAYKVAQEKKEKKRHSKLREDLEERIRAYDSKIDDGNKE